MNKVPFIYTVGIALLRLLIHIGALFSLKLRKAKNARKNWKQDLKNKAEKCLKPGKKTIWMHAASLGEFEQGRPLIEKLHANHKDVQFVLSFFSPSGYEPSKNYKYADLVCYIPFDTKKNAEFFIDIIEPDFVIWVKYEYWLHHLNCLNKKKIKVILVSAFFQKRQIFFKWYGSWYRNVFTYFSHIFIQQETSLKLISDFVPHNLVTVAGDTRFDRVIEIAGKWETVPGIKDWIDNRKTVVAGSTWAADEEVLALALTAFEDVCLIIVPHKVDEKSIEETINKFPDAELYSNLNGQSSLKFNKLIINKIGLLSKLYSYADICYIGGGFNPTGIHNCLEAAVYGKPLVWGPNYNRYAEATGLIEGKAAIAFSTAIECQTTLLEMFSNTQSLEQKGKRAKEFVQQHAGATEKILEFIYKNRLLTSE